MPVRGWVGLALAVMLSGCDFGGGPDAKPPPLTPPEAPKQVVAQAADASALVTWSVPPADGGSPLLYYVVRCVPECGGALVKVPDTQATVLGLNNGFTYVFKVSAVNAMGEGQASVETDLVTPQAGMSIPKPTAPGQPRSVVPTAGNGQAYVSWLAPSSYGAGRCRTSRSWWSRAAGCSGWTRPRRARSSRTWTTAPRTRSPSARPTRWAKARARARRPG
ncbi:fibronectin type III domain-containing protein [Corallococcus sp. 4LFB]|uniref:fibronectin type III domain-containing protein n=1 Tax=Corallococcus sp. 4LFB TaxID=3383249 RepID=UPI0039747179